MPLLRVHHGSSKRKAPTSEPKPRGRPRKTAPIETSAPIALPLQTIIGIHNTAMSATEISSKVYERTTCEEAISDPIHGQPLREDCKTWSNTILGSIMNYQAEEQQSVPDGSVTRYKARLVAQGYSQIQGIDFNKTFAPIARRESLSIFLAISALFGFLIEQMDIVGAYLETEFVVVEFITNYRWLG